MTEKQLEEKTSAKPKLGLNDKPKSGSGRVRRGRPKKRKPKLESLHWSKLLPSEILQMVSSAKTKAEKVKILKHLRCNAIEVILNMNYNPNLVCLLPEGEPPFKRNESPVNSGGHTTLHQEQRKLYMFFKGGKDDLTKAKRESLFIRILENLHGDDADLLIAAKDKKLQEKFRITQSVVLEAYPEFKVILGDS